MPRFIHLVRSGRFNGLGDVLDDFGERACVDVKEIAEDVDVLWCTGMRTDQRGVAFERRFEFVDADAAAFVEIGNVGAVLVPIRIDDAIGREGRRPQCE